MSFPHLTSSMVVSGAEIKLYIRYSSRDPLTLYTSASQLILVAEGREKMVASLKDREQQGQLEVYSIPLSLILLSS